MIIKCCLPPGKLNARQSEALRADLNMHTNLRFNMLSAIHHAHHSLYVYGIGGFILSLLPPSIISLPGFVWSGSMCQSSVTMLLSFQRAGESLSALKDSLTSLGARPSVSQLAVQKETEGSLEWEVSHAFVRCLCSSWKGGEYITEGFCFEWIVNFHGREHTFITLI